MANTPPGAMGISKQERYFSCDLHLLYECGRMFFFFFCIRCDDCVKSSGRWLLGSQPSTVVRQLAPRAWCPLQCLLAKTVGILSPGVAGHEIVKTNPSLRCTLHIAGTLSKQASNQPTKKQTIVLVVIPTVL